MEKESFYTKVYEVVKQIPFGRCTSYGSIAKKIGMAKSARMVGYAMSACPKDQNIPAHRVVNSVGLLTGKFHFEGINRMQQLLEAEGIIIKNDKVKDFKKAVFWDPNSVD